MRGPLIGVNMSKELTERINALVVAQLENGLVPWRKPWNTAGFMPTSLTSNKEYRGINALILAICGMEYERPLWVTYKQAQALGGTVRKGETALPVVYWSRFVRKADDGPGKDGPGVTRKTGAFMKYYSVFNVAQCDGIEIPAQYDIKREPVATLPALDAIIASYVDRPEIFYREQGRAYYNPVSDSITLPPVNAFESAESHAYTLCHEMIHSTGHESRLKRFAEDETPAHFGDANYAREELVADIGAQILLSENGIQYDMENSASYIAGWLKALKNDPSLIMSAAGKAQTAADRVQGKVYEPVKEEVTA
jgi:antirestriction protein ArdC